MQHKQKFAYIALGAVLVLALQFSADTIVDNAGAQDSGRAPIKYILSVDYPVGQKADYIAWVKSVAGDLQAPAEVKSLRSYDNYFGASPNRFIELEFDSMADASSYLENEKIQAVFDDWPNHGVNAQVHVMKLRGDYTK